MLLPLSNWWLLFCRIMHYKPLKIWWTVEGRYLLLSFFLSSSIEAWKKHFTNLLASSVSRMSLGHFFFCCNVCRVQSSAHWHSRVIAHCLLFCAFFGTTPIDRCPLHGFRIVWLSKLLRPITVALLLHPRLEITTAWPPIFHFYGKFCSLTGASRWLIL